jgi:chromosome segregation ATPase
MEDAKDEQAHLEREIEKLRKINDDMRNKSNRLRKELDAMRDSVKDLELDSQRPHMEDNEYTRRIRALENKLDKAMIKYNEAQSIRKTYEQIVRRLTEERVGFDNQLAAIERTLGAKQKDFEELLLLSGDANHARETALGELERVRAGYEEERKKREKELRERHQMVQLRRQMLERMKYRERMRHQLASGKSVLVETKIAWRGAIVGC